MSEVRNAIGAGVASAIAGDMFLYEDDDLPGAAGSSQARAPRFEATCAILKLSKAQAKQSLSPDFVLDCTSMEDCFILKQAIR